MSASARPRVLIVCTHNSGSTGTEDQRLAVFRRVRDEIAARLRAWLAGQ